MKSRAGDSGQMRFRDIEVRSELTRILLIDHAFAQDTLVLEEFGCNEARADLAVINGEMHCYEIKSSFDTLNRLANQIPAYSGVFDRVTLVADQRHISQARTIIPEWWGMVRVGQSMGEIKLRELRKAKRNPTPCASALARMLWRDEAYKLLKSQALHEGLQKASVQKIWQAIGDSLPTDVISNAVREAIKQRGGSGFRPPLLQSGDTFPTASMCPDFQSKAD